MSDSVPYTAPQRASFWKKLGPGGLSSLVLAFGGGLLLVPVLVQLARVRREAAGDPEAPGDAILVLGRRLREDRPTEVFRARLDRAAELWRAGLAPRVVVAGGITGRATLSEAEVGRALLLAAGLPEEAVLVEDRSQHTLENLFHVRETLRREGWESLILVSDPLHLARARAVAEGLGVRVRCAPAHAAPPVPGSAHWWGRTLWEAFLLHWYRTGAAWSRLIRSRAQLSRIS